MAAMPNVRIHDGHPWLAIVSSNSFAVFWQARVELVWLAQLQPLTISASLR
jgi:hypothetical protein